MFDQNLNELIVYGCVGVITGAPFFFRAWVKSIDSRDLTTIDRMTSLLTTIIFIALFLGAFLFSNASRRTGELLLAASILSFSFLYQSRYRALRAGVQSLPKPARALRESAVKVLFVLIALSILALMRQFPLAITSVLLLPFAMPFFIRLQQPTEKMSKSALKANIIETFKRAGVSLSEVYLIDSANPANTNALVAGSRFGRGIFGRTLFITLSLFEQLSEEELRAVLLHEAAHFKKNHIPKRIFFGIIFALLSIFWIAVPVTFLFQKDPTAIVVASVSAIILQFYLIGRLVYRQELEADLGAVQSGASSDALISALRKLSGTSYDQNPSALTRLVFGFFHPSGALREAAIRYGTIPKSLDAVPYKRYCFAYSLFVVGFVFWSAQNIAVNLTRIPASSSIDPAKISHLEGG